MKGNLSIINFLQLRGGNATNVRGPKVMVKRMTSAEASPPPPPPLIVLATIVSQPMGIWTGPRPRYTSAILPTSNGLKTVKLNGNQKIFYVLIIFQSLPPRHSARLMGTDVTSLVIKTPRMELWRTLRCAAAIPTCERYKWVSWYQIF